MILLSSGLFSILLAVLFVVFVDSTSEDDLKVTVKQGVLKGRRLTTRNGQDILAFLGIPYAKPPIGEMRFKHSEPASSWSGVRDATKEGSECIQYDFGFDGGKFKGDEDCLFLNVYTPQLNATKPSAVMVWIHGGGFYCGSSKSHMYGPDFLVDKDVVLVSLNYRLGPMGFLSTGDSVCPGNNGLKDQTLALEWVRDNIAQFGGDPDKVTIFGESSGGCSTHYHMISPMSKGLFHGAISQSGTALFPGLVTTKEQGSATAKRLAKVLDCPIDSSAELVECLRTKDAKALIEVRPDLYPFAFKAVVEGTGDGAFISDEPIKLHQNACSIANVPWMTGLTSGDGAVAAIDIIQSEKQVNDLIEDFDRIVPLVVLQDTDSHNASEEIRKFYFNNESLTLDNRMPLRDIFTDSLFLQPADYSVRLVSKLNTAPTFYYLFDYKGPASYSTIFGGDPDRDYGVCHCDDLQYLFPQDNVFPNATFSERDLKMVDIMTTLWTDFAKTGHPTPKGSPLPEWNPIEMSELEYLHIGPRAEVHMSGNLLGDRADLWTRLRTTGKT